MSTSKSKELDFINSLGGVSLIMSLPNGYYTLHADDGVWYATYNVEEGHVVCIVEFEGETTSVDDTEHEGCLLEECLERAGVDYERM